MKEYKAYMILNNSPFDNYYRKKADVWYPLDDSTNTPIKEDWLTSLNKRESDSTVYATNIPLKDDILSCVKRNQAIVLSCDQLTDSFTLKLNIPALDRESLKIIIDDTLLSVEYKQKLTNSNKSTIYARHVPALNKIITKSSAKYEDGVLTIRLDYKPDTSSRLEIKLTE